VVQRAAFGSDDDVVLARARVDERHGPGLAAARAGRQQEHWTADEATCGDLALIGAEVLDQAFVEGVPVALSRGHARSIVKDSGREGEHLRDRADAPTALLKLI